MPYPAKVTDDQVIEALRVHGTQAKAGRALGITHSSIQERLKRMALKGYSPKHDMTHTVPDGFTVKGVSSYYDRRGKLRGQWVKSQQDAEAVKRMLETFAASLAVECKGLAQPLPAPTAELRHSLSAYLIGDAHFGMYAWGEECGADFDTDIATKDLRAALDLLVSGSPPSETAMLIDVGDFLHSDNRSNMTPASGNMLDTDSRFQRVIRIAVEALRYCIGRMLQKHGTVRVYITPGNHDPDSAGWLAMVLAAYYEQEPRVFIERSPAKYFYFRFDKVLIGITHGDKVKLPELPSIMAADRPEDWGQSKHRYWWTGHIHHTKHQEYRGCFVEAFNTLAAGDAWHHASGYRAARQMQRLDLDPEHGIYSRGIANLGMIRGQVSHDAG